MKKLFLPILISIFCIPNLAKSQGVCGTYDGYFQDELNLWDVAAGIVLVNEAGGKINNINMNKIEKIKILATNNSIYEKMLKKFNNF